MRRHPSSIRRNSVRGPRRLAALGAVRPARPSPPWAAATPNGDRQPRRPTRASPRPRATGRPTAGGTPTATRSSPRLDRRGAARARRPWPQAEARLRERTRRLRSAARPTLPSLDADGAGQRDRTEPGRRASRRSSSSSCPRATRTRAASTLEASYDLDLSARTARRWPPRSRADAAARRSGAGAADASTAVAQAYGDLARLAAERRRPPRPCATASETQTLVADRVRNGLDTRAELKQAEAADAGVAGRRRVARRADRC